MSNENKKHNWFSLNGDIRINENITTEDFLKKLEKLGFEFLGSAGISKFKDEDYE